MAASTRRHVSRAVTGYTLAIVGSHGVIRRALPEHGELEIGRDEAAAIRLDSGQVSRRHAVLRIAAGMFGIEDLGSANGTVIGRDRIAARTVVDITVGEPIHIADFVLIVSPAYSADQPTAEAGDDALPLALPDDVVVHAPAMLAVYRDLARAAPSDLGVLLLGETGVGKDVAARSLHHLSARRDRPFLRLNCATLSDSLLESELFGHERGAFTGAVTAKPGLLESADGGSVFLDEIGEMPVALQAKLLHVLENREVTRLGSVTSRTVDLRFIAATNRDLTAEIEAGRFRSDLFYRLSAFTVEVPPLRDRKEDIVPLAVAIAERAVARLGKRTAPTLGVGVPELLETHGWPGNVRELRNVIERAVAVSAGAVLEVDAIGLAPVPHGADPKTLPGLDLSPDEAEDRRQIIDALVRANGNQSTAAKILGISRSTLIHRLDAYRITRPRKRPGATK